MGYTISCNIDKVLVLFTWQMDHGKVMVYMKPKNRGSVRAIIAYFPHLEWARLIIIFDFCYFSNIEKKCHLQVEMLTMTSLLKKSINTD